MESSFSSVVVKEEPSSDGETSELANCSMEQAEPMNYANADRRFYTSSMAGRNGNKDDGHHGATTSWGTMDNPYGATEHDSETDCSTDDMHGHDDNGHESDSSEDGAHFAGIRQIVSVNKNKVTEMFQGMGQQEEPRELVLDILRDLQSKMAAMQERQERMEHKQDQLQELMKLVLVKERGDARNQQTPSHDTAQPELQNQGESPASSTETPPASSTETPPATLLPRIINGPKDGTYLLGGNESMRRSVNEYKADLREVQRKRSTDNERGRLLCVILLKREIPKMELATHNVTGNSRDENNKKCKIPQINRDIIHSIFHQAKIQFPGFTDWYTDVRCKTVEALNECCKRARYEQKKIVYAYAWGKQCEK